MLSEIRLAQNHTTNTIRRLTTSPISVIQNKVKDMVGRGLYDQTLQLYKQELHPSGIYSNTSILPSLIKACCSSCTPTYHHHFGVQLHCLALKSGSDSDPVTSNSLISMYAKFSDVGSAYQVFDKMPNRDTISWNAIINCYIQNGYYIRSLEMLRRMSLCGFAPKPELVAGILSFCAQRGDLSMGKQIHGLVIVDERIAASIFVSTALIDLYFKCHRSLIAFHVFDQMEIRNEVSWTAMVSGCIENQNFYRGIDCFTAMQAEGIKPNSITLLVVLRACTELKYVDCGKAIHGYAYRHGLDSNHRLSTALMHMYCECTRELHAARIIFVKTKVKDVVIWSSIITSYSRNGDFGEAMKLFSQMRLEGLEPNSVTLLAIISACTSLSSLSQGLGVHCYILKSGLHFDVFIGNALINMYSKCGCLAASHQIFTEMAIRDFVSWSTLIGGYGLHGCGEEALGLFREMQERGMEPDATTWLVILSACNHSGLVEEGVSLFNSLLKNTKIPLTVEHYACYIDLLGKSGKIEDACEVVRTMPLTPSTKILTSLVSACKFHGRLEVAEMLAHQLIESEAESAANHTLLSMIYAESGNWNGVEEVRRVMRVKGLNKCYGFSRIDMENEYS